MGSVDVFSRTQRIVIDSSKRLSVSSPNRHVSVINAGPPGPPGARGLPPEINAPAAHDTQDFPSLTWIMDYDLGYFPAAFRFFDEEGNEWEPEDIVYVNENRSIAQWPEPMMGSWYVS